MLLLGQFPTQEDHLPPQWHFKRARDAHVEALAQAWGQLETSPLQAAERAEQLLPELAGRDDLAPWLALVTAISGRIHTLSRFDTLDPCIRFFTQHRDTLRAPETVCLHIDACFFGALVFRQPDHPRISVWAQRCEQAFDSQGTPFARLSAANYLLLYRIWSGNLTGADALSARMGALLSETTDVQSRLLCYSMTSMIHRLFLDHDTCRARIDDALALARRSEIHFWDSHLYMQGAFLALSRNNLEDAREWLACMSRAAPPEHYLDRSGYHYALAWLHYLDNSQPRALEHAGEAVRLAEKSGAIFPQAITQMGLGQLNLEQGNVTSGLYYMGRARRSGRRMRSTRPLRFMRGLVQADISLRLGMKKRGLRALERALRLGREEHYMNYVWWRGERMAALCAQALEAGIETTYVRQLIQRRRLRRPPTAGPHWYWPLRLAVLGAPHVVLDEEPLAPGPKVLELLLALACLGPGGDWVSRDRLADRLWPDSDGDQAQRALDTAIHRLRQQLGTESMIISRPGFVALDPGQCHVDYWALEERLQKPAMTPREALELVAHARALQNPGPEHHYRFLDPEPLRHRLITRIISAVSQNELPPAIAHQCLENLVALMPTHETLWQALIEHHVNAESPLMARETWQRCRRALLDQAGTEPSPATRALLTRRPDNGRGD